MNNTADRIFSAMMLIGAVAVFVAVFTACGQQTRYESPYKLLSEKQRAATVAIHAACLEIAPSGFEVRQWTGSGVITGKHTILTADHIVRCESGIFEMSVQLLSGTLIKAEAVVQAEDHDIAKIVTIETLPYFSFEIGPPPPVGSVVCSESARPTRARKCGRVLEVDVEPSNRDLGIGLQVEGGNSGSGVFDSGGRLVGIVTMRRRDMSAGRAASLWSHREVMGTSY